MFQILLISCVQDCGLGGRNLTLGSVDKRLYGKEIQRIQRIAGQQQLASSFAADCAKTEQAKCLFLSGNWQEMYEFCKYSTFEC